MNLTKRKLFMNSFFTSQFNCFPLVWMCLNRTINNKINRLRKTYLRIVYNDNKSFQELPDKAKGVTIYVKNVLALAVEMFKMSNNYSISLISEIFDTQNNVYDFRNPSEVARRNVQSAFNGTGSISFLSPKIWDIVPSELKQLEAVNVFKGDIKKWKPVNCPCRLCRSYIQNVGFFISLIFS